jgi:hypothetical protein
MEEEVTFYFNYEIQQWVCITCGLYFAWRSHAQRHSAIHTRQQQSTPLDISSENQLEQEFENSSFAPDMSSEEDFVEVEDELVSNPESSDEEDEDGPYAGSRMGGAIVYNCTIYIHSRSRQFWIKGPPSWVYW